MWKHRKIEASLIVYIEALHLVFLPNHPCIHLKPDNEFPFHSPSRAVICITHNHITSRQVDSNNIQLTSSVHFKSIVFKFHFSIYLHNPRQLNFFSIRGITLPPILSWPLLQSFLPLAPSANKKRASKRGSQATPPDIKGGRITKTIKQHNRQ